MWIRTFDNQVWECEKVGTDFVTTYNKDIYGENEVKKYGDKIEDICDVVFFLDECDTVFLIRSVEDKELTNTLNFFANNRAFDSILGIMYVPCEDDEDDEDDEVELCKFDFNERVFKPSQVKLLMEEQIENIKIFDKVS